MKTVEEVTNQLAEMQRHRDAWRGYAYGTHEKPHDFLDGDMVGPAAEGYHRPPTFLEVSAEKLAAVHARYKSEVERLTATLSAPATAHEPGYKAGWNRGAKFALARVTAFIAKLEGE